MIETIIETKDYLTKSNLPASDFVINPYIGCPHGCKYCYACFMKRFTKHKENWGDFIDIKYCSKSLNTKKIAGKSVFLSSVTDCYNIYETKYLVTQNILKQLVGTDVELTISTKSKLILRDIDLLKKIKKLKVAISINTLNENFKNDMDNADSIIDRLHTLKELNKNGIYTVLFMSPIFPKITNFKQLIQCSKTFVKEYWFENLNLRGGYKENILEYIYDNYPQYKELYDAIYRKNDYTYWQQLAIEIEKYCHDNSIKYCNFFYHDKLVQKKKTTK